MDIPSNVPAVLPPLRAWSKNEQNRCESDDIVSYWMAHDVVTFIIDLEKYHPALHEFLTPDEKEQEHRIKTVISRQRFVVSRILLKHILSKILAKKNIVDIILIRHREGRILVKDQPDIFICLSYTAADIAITVGKRKLGCDIEEVRPIRDKKIIACPIFHNYPWVEGKERTRQVIHVWTLIESYAKLFDKNPYLLLDASSSFRDADFVSYCINQHQIFSLASARGHFTNVLVWLGIQGMGKT